MKDPISKLKSILSQSTNIDDSKIFFPLLHEFVLVLGHSKFNAALQLIKAKENKMKQWVAQMPHTESVDLKELYSQQYQIVSDWYSLNQLAVFYERYDLGFYDFLVAELKKKDLDISQLRKEHIELMQYALTGVCPNIFPTIEEYKIYMRRIIDALEDVMDDSDQLTIYIFSFDKKSNTLLIEGQKPIKFFRDTKTSSLINYLDEKNWKSIDWSDVSNDLDIEPDAIKRTVRQINDRIPNPLPPFLNTSDHPAKRGKKIIAVNALYKEASIPPRAA